MYTLLPILDLDPLDLQIVASSTNQVILAEPIILRLLGYITLKKRKGVVRIESQPLYSGR
ncbi:hypothetical protein THZG08_210043 [Vibrio owensii]|uniref:Uncharacterized protein n=1 Tax=Vibrio owensii TaxID=696485 RepID=A0AAU9Q9M5_9VIBR|nr:hypothetical protein THZG08_210043 [Vibrio owensii]CAH1532664.1 hypothetical protein THF1D04_30459 [Vibrio owensii]CAH1559999.1 hypothetical protein THOA03_210043 [Vibrio owensii]